MKMNKKLLVLMMSFTIAGAAFTGCGQSKPNNDTVVESETPENTTEENQVVEEVVEDSTTEEADPTPSQELFYVITDGIELPNSTEMATEMFNDTYGINTDLLDSYYVSMPLMNIRATEIAVFELKDEANVDEVIEGIKKRQSALEDQWKSYLPDQLELVQNYETAVKGNKVIFVISEEKQAIIDKFNAQA